MFHLLKYRLKQLIKNKSIIFWSLFFPIVLSCFFKMAFGNLDQQFDLKTVPVGIVIIDNSPQNEQFMDILTKAQHNDTQLFDVSSLSQVKAEVALKESVIDGYYILSRNHPNLVINRNGISQTLLTDFLQQYTYVNATLTEIAYEHPNQLSEDLVNQLLNQQNYTEEISYGENEPHATTIYFFTVLAMACMFGMNWGVKNSEDIQANQSPTGIRMNMSPLNKGRLIFVNLLATFIIFFSEVMLVLIFLRFVLRIDFGNRWALIIFTCLIASILSISLGSLIGSAIKGNHTIKNNIVVVISIFGGFLAGMMSVEVKYFIDKNAPLISWLNPSSLITDALYKLFYYTDLKNYYLTIGMMVLLILATNIANYLIMRRQTYVSL